MGSLPVRASTTAAAAGYSSRTSRTMVCCRKGSRAMFAEMEELEPEREMKPRKLLASLSPPPPWWLLLAAAELRRCSDDE